MKAQNNEKQEFLKVTIITENGMFTFVNPTVIAVAENGKIVYKVIKPEAPQQGPLSTFQDQYADDDPSTYLEHFVSYDDGA